MGAMTSIIAAVAAHAYVATAKINVTAWATCCAKALNSLARRDAHSNSLNIERQPGANGLQLLLHLNLLCMISPHLPRPFCRQLFQKPPPASSHASHLKTHRRLLSTQHFVSSTRIPPVCSFRACPAPPFHYPPKFLTATLSFDHHLAIFVCRHSETDQHFDNRPKILCTASFPHNAYQRL
jgi:hypothetical protein